MPLLFLRATRSPENVHRARTSEESVGAERYESTVFKRARPTRLAILMSDESNPVRLKRLRADSIPIYFRARSRLRHIASTNFRGDPKIQFP